MLSLTLLIANGYNCENIIMFFFLVKCSIMSPKKKKKKAQGLHLKKLENPCQKLLALVTLHCNKLLNVSLPEESEYLKVTFKVTERLLKVPSGTMPEGFTLCCNYKI